MPKDREEIVHEIDGLNLTTPMRAVGRGRDKAHRLLGAATILGVDHHVEAVEAERDERTGEQVRANRRDKDDYFDQALEIVGGAGRCVEFKELPGRKYILFITPYQE
jgi:hypothetical protein